MWCSYSLVIYISVTFLSCFVSLTKYVYIQSLISYCVKNYTLIGNISIFKIKLLLSEDILKITNQTSILLFHRTFKNKYNWYNDYSHINVCPFWYIKKLTRVRVSLFDDYVGIKVDYRTSRPHLVGEFVVYRISKCQLIHN